tara:strand:+ start:1110 stop:2429 length:1320 start_codon:yes stop_codon:yes gene_type:complete
MAKKIIQSEIQLKDATIDYIAEIASNSLYPNQETKPLLSLKDVSGNSGAKTYICYEEDIPKCIVKITDGESIMNSHPNTIARVNAATKVMRENSIAPKIIMQGSDFHIERSAGTSVMKDFFHFQTELAPPEKLAELLAKIHAAPTNWYESLKESFLERDSYLGTILRPMPPHAPCWCLPWSGFDTGMLVLGVGNPDIETSKKIMELEIETGVYKKIMQCSAFFPVSEAAKRQVVVHNDFKPDNILRDPETGSLTAIDYDLVQVGAAVMDFGLPYTMWLGARYTSFEFRKAFIKSYLIASKLPASDSNVNDMMLDCEVNTIVAFPGLLANIYDAEVPLLRGTKHPTAKAKFQASGPNASPTGTELVDLLADAVNIVRSDRKLIHSCLQDGLVMTMFQQDGFGSKLLNSWLKEMQKNRMLRLFGIAETEGADLFVSRHARK